MHGDTYLISKGYWAAAGVVQAEKLCILPPDHNSGEPKKKMAFDHQATRTEKEDDLHRLCQAMR